MNYAEYQQQQQIEAEEFLATYADELEPIIEPGSDTGPRRNSHRPASDKALHTMVLSGVEVVRERQQVSATETTFKTWKAPSSCPAGIDPEELGFYAITAKQAEMANKERAIHGIEFTRNAKGQVRGGKSGKTRETKAEKAARLAARFNR